MYVFAFDFDSVAILLGYPRYAEHTERLHRHHWKVKNSTLPAASLITVVAFGIAISFLIPSIIIIVLVALCFIGCGSLTEGVMTQL